MRGADLLVKTLATAGVTRIFALSGNQIMPIFDACVDAKIEIIHTRHEAAAVFMAEAYAQLTGEIGVALVTAGAAAANAMGALFVSSESETPVLFLTGDSPIAQDGRGAFQELDQLAMTKSITKLSFRPTRADAFGVDTARAIRIAKSGRLGPVHMALPYDLVDGDANGGIIPTLADLATRSEVLDQDDARLIAQTIAAARRPIVICGPSMSETRSPGVMANLAEALNAPVVAMESLRGFNDPALGDFKHALVQADVILSLGKRVDFTLKFGAAAAFHPACSWIVINADADERDLARRNLQDRMTACYAASPGDSVGVIIQEAQKAKMRGSWRSDVEAMIANRDGLPQDKTDDGKITPAQLCAAIQRQIEIAEKSVVICDGGEFGQWAMATTRADRRIVNGLSGAIGGGLCYGLGAKQAAPEATVFSVMGDGSAGFHIAEFETAVRNDTPYVVVIGNDECWNAEHLVQIRNYGPDRLISCKLSSARYDEVAKGFGAHGEYVTKLADLDAALRRAVNCGKVACVNVQIEGIPAPVTFEN